MQKKRPPIHELDPVDEDELRTIVNGFGRRLSDLRSCLGDYRSLPGKVV